MIFKVPENQHRSGHLSTSAITAPIMTKDYLIYRAMLHHATHLLSQ